MAAIVAARSFNKIKERAKQEKSQATFSAFLRRLLSIIGRVFDPVNETHAARDSRYSISLM
jgi:hypothetical protein